MEKAHFAGALQCNDYPPAFVRAALKQRTPRERNPEAEQGEGKPMLMMLSYGAGISEWIRKGVQHQSGV